MTTNQRDPQDLQHTKEQPNSATKVCVQCGSAKPLTEFLRRTGRRSGKHGRRGTCRACRRQEAALPAIREAVRGGHAKARSVPSSVQGDTVHVAPDRPAQATASASSVAPVSVGASQGVSSVGNVVSESAPAPQGTAAAPGEAGAAARKKRRRGGKRAKGAQQRHAPKPAGEASPPSTPRRDKHDPADASFLRQTAKGFIRMRGKTDNGRRWYQEVDPELAQVLVREGAAVVVNRSTIRRLFSSREFKRLILTRDNYICHFCGNYGDTIDHKLPRAKGGHTTPLNCVCACYECNQLKANRDMDEFVSTMDEYMR